MIQVSEGVSHHMTDVRPLFWMRDARRTGLILAAYAVLALLVIPIYPHFVSPNEFTRWALDVAVLEHHSLEVTSVVAQFGPRFDGLAVAAEYTAVFAAIILLVSVAVRRDWRRLLKFVAGGAPFALLLAAYHAAVFGSVFSNPYSFSTEYRELHESGLFGLDVPSVATAAKILIDPTYGL